tara:strand:+ start:954 stop:1166 length:213 start_codon:yes stop_codon:yes gene_type:complete
MTSKKEKQTKTTTIKMNWNWRAHMSSLILFMERGNDDNRSYAKDELMRLADHLDEYFPKLDKGEMEVVDK